MKENLSLQRRCILMSGIATVLSNFLGMESKAAERAVDHSRSIVIYFSRTGSTEKLAKQVSQLIGADLLRLEVRDPYADDYGDMTDIAREEKRTGKRREIKTVIPDLSQYQTIYLGTPYWWGGISVPMATFLMDHPLDGKRIKPFVVSASSDPEGAWADIRRFCPKSDIREGFHSTQSSINENLADFERWINK